MAVPALDDEVHRVVSTALDVDFYRAMNGDLDLEGEDLIRHYATVGWRQGRDPAPWFSAAAYLEANADIEATGVEPLFHFLTRGLREGREAVPSARAADWLYVNDGRRPPPRWKFRRAEEPGNAALIEMREEDADYRLAETEFDRTFYLAGNLDVATSGMEPLEHFLVSGWREGRDPNPNFSVVDYLEANPDIAAIGVNPFVHYLRQGRTEGRRPRSELGFRYEILTRLRTLDVRVADVRAAQADLPLDPPEVLARALKASGNGLADLHITFSHDDYVRHMGGVQLCLRREGARLKAMGRDHLHLFPARAWPVVRTAGEPGPLGVLWNGEPVGTFAPRVVAQVLAGAAAGMPPDRRSFAVHSLLGHCADETADIVEAAGLNAGWFWLHDFASLCAGFHLMRNDLEDCAAPPPDSMGCQVCVYGAWRARHVAEHRRLFERLELTVASPSAPTLDLWRARWPGPVGETLVHPHLKLVDRGPAPEVELGRPFRLAFAGFPAAHKGWPIFRDLVMRHQDDPRYAFLHLGAHTPGGLPIEHHPVSVGDSGPNAMRDALERLEVDAVLIWPLCRETFSLAAYESVASGAALITGPDSGNVAAFVQSSGQGLVLADEKALAAAFESGEVVRLSRAERRPRLYDLAYGGLTADLLA